MSETVQEVESQKPARKSNKPLMIVAIVLAQLVAAYFLVGFFLSRGETGPKPGKAAEAATKSENREQRFQFDHVFVVKDLIVNPAGTNGLRFLLTTIGLEVSSDATEKECEKRNVQIHDAIISILTSKTLPQLDDVNYRDSLKAEIKGQINSDLASGSVINVYFSKFIIQ